MVGPLAAGPSRPAAAVWFDVAPPGSYNSPVVRGPNPSGRGPAHLTVLPGGAQRPVEEDERTTIDPTPPQEGDEALTPSGGGPGTADEHWEDGTTVAESARKMIEEPTIDEQARIPPLQVVAPMPARAVARLTVSVGPDHGRTYELTTVSRPTLVGRAVENDVVLTDLSVSRRHLELGWEHEAWVLRDSGSGNGTLINDRLEDGRCQLRHGDRIEIGNTVFRFEHPASAEGDAADAQVGGWGQSDDDEELATVNGRPGRTTGQTPAPERQLRPPAPMPPSPRRPSSSATPPVRGPSMRVDATIPPDRRPRPPAPGLPAPRPPAPMAGDPRRDGDVPIARNVSAERSAARPPFDESGGFPALSGPLPTAHAGGMPMGASSATLAPYEYGSPEHMMRPVALPPSFVTGRGIERRKVYVGVAAGALLVAIIVGAATSSEAPPPAGRVAAPTAGSPTGGGSPGSSSAGGAGAGVQIVPAGSGSATVATTTAGTGAGSETGSGALIPTGTVTGTGSGTGTATGSGSGSPPAAGAGSAPAAGSGSAPVTGSGAGAATDGTGAGAGSATATGAGTTATSSTPPPTPTTTAAPTRATPPRRTVRPTPPRHTRTARVDRTTRIDLDADVRAPKPLAGDKVVAAAEKKAEAHYRARKFSDAAATLRAVIDEVDAATARRLKGVAASYESLGANITTGNSPDPTVAYTALSRALATDRKIGEAHQAYIRGRLAPIAPKAAATFLARGKFEDAKRAADTAVNVGAGGTPTISQVRSTLETKAGQIYEAAAKQLAKKPEDAKAQLRRVMAMVPSDSPWYAKASRLLKGARKDDDE